jgi:sugar/nucleoside kinase (ribokinase family)
MTAFDVGLLTIGHVSKDLIRVDGRTETMLGGAVYYNGVALRQLDLSVAVVTQLGSEDFPLLEELRREGIQVFASPAAKTTTVKTTYNSAGMDQRQSFEVATIPNIWARIYAVIPIIAGEVDLDLIEMLAARGPVALDVQGFVRFMHARELVYRQWPEMKAGLSHVTYLKVDRTEAELLTGLTDPIRAAHSLAAYGPREIVITQSSGVTVLADGQIYQAPFTPRSLAGRTGRGDTCFATYLGRRFTDSPEEATQWAGAITTLKQEKPGPWDGNMAAVEAILSRA